MAKIKGKTAAKTDNLDQIRRNYLKMDEKGQLKLKEVSEKLLEIHKITKEN